MALTPEEQQELELLQQDIAVESENPQVDGLTPDEQNELQLLQQDIKQQEGGVAETAEAAIEGFGQGATLGFLPQIQAAVAQIVPDPTKTIDEQLEAQGFNIQEDKDSFVAARDAFIERSQKLEEQSPIASTIGKVGGAIATGIAAGGAGIVTKGVSAVRKVVQAAKTGGILGFLENPGDTKGVVDPLQIRDRIENSVKGAALGFGLGTSIQAVGAVGKALKAAPGVIKNFAELKALKASGAMLKDFVRIMGRKQANKTGKFLLDKRIVAAGDDFERIGKKVAALKKETGAKLGDIYEKITDDLLDRRVLEKMTTKQLQAMSDTSLDMVRLSNELRAGLAKSLKGKAGSESVIKRLETELKTLATNGNNLNVQEVHKIRQSFDELINFDRLVADQPLLQKQFIKIRNVLNDKIQGRLKFFDNVFGSKKASSLLKANDDFSKLAEIDTIVIKRIARDNSNAAFGLRERISAGAGAIIGTTIAGPVGGVIGGLAGGFTTRALRKFGTSVVADVGNKVAKIMLKDPLRMGKFGQVLADAAAQSPRAYVIAIESFLNDPQFKQAVKGGK